MGRYERSRNARCPFYKSEERVGAFRIRCDGLQPGTWLHMVFADHDEMIRWRDKYCKRCWKECPVAKMINTKYEEEQS